MRVHFEFDTSNCADETPLLAVIGALSALEKKERAVQPNRITKEHVPTVKSNEGVENPILASHIAYAENVLKDAGDAYGAAVTEEAEKITLDDIKVVCTAYMRAHKPEGLTKKLAEFGAARIVGKDALTEDKYAAFHADLTAALAS